MSAVNFDALRYTKPDGKSYPGRNADRSQMRDFSEEIKRLKGNASGSDVSGVSVRDISAENAREKVLQYQEDLEYELLLRSRDPSRGRREEEEEHILFESEHDSAFESKTLVELAGMKPDEEINRDADGTDELTEEQLNDRKDYLSQLKNEDDSILAEIFDRIKQGVNRLEES